MKKLSERQRLHLFRTANKRAIRKFGRKKAPKRKVFTAKMWYRGTVWDVVVPDTSKVNYFPEVMCFDKNPAETLRALSTVRSKLNKFTGKKLWMRPNLNPKKRIKITSYAPMDKVKYVSTSAALVLAAEYERKTTFMDEPPSIFDLHKWDKKLLHKFEQIGFFERFGYVLTNDSQPESDGDLLTVPFYSGTKTEMAKYDEKLLSLIEHVDPNVVIPDKMRLALNGALGEAASNAREHAYVDGFNYLYPTVGLWWATGAASKKQRKIVISLFDQGVTIPITYPKLPLFGKIQATLGLFDERLSTPYRNDAILIQTAAIHGKTGRKRESGSQNSVFSDKKVGGLGLPQIKDAIDLCGGGSLMILSRGGRYLYSLSNGETEEKLDYFENSIGGTLIEWTVTVPETA